MTPPRPQALVFDLGGVIVDHDNSVMHRRIASRCQAGWTDQHIAEAAGDACWGTGRPVRKLYDVLRWDAGYAADWPTFVEDWCCHLLLNPSMLTFVEQLSRVYRVMIFSNTNLEHWENEVRASGGRLGAFERYLSYELGHAKPSLLSFQKVAQNAGRAPETLLFFDDVAANVEGARAAGLQAELFVSEPDLRCLLVDRGLWS